MALLNRLENDRSLARFAGQFVPLKIVTDGNPEWGKWARKYPINARGIPQLYVVRADGEMLYGAAGALSGDKLPSMMLATLNQAGRPFNPVEADLLARSVTSAEESFAAEDFLGAAQAMSAILTLGTPSELGSYAAPALRAKELFTNLETELAARVEKTKSELSSGSDGDPLDAMLVLAEAEAAYLLFPNWKARAASVTRDYKRDPTRSDSLAQAVSLVKARLLLGSPKPSIRGRAVGAYTAVIRKHGGTPAAEIARAELAKIDPDAKILQPDANTLPPGTKTLPPGATSPENVSRFRNWTAGGFKTRAMYLQQRAGKVQLQKEDGKKIVVDISVLSESDQAFLRSRDRDSDSP